jgi:hypothetical protein
LHFVVLFVTPQLENPHRSCVSEGEIEECAPLTNPTLSDPALEVLALIRSSEVMKSLVEAHPDLRELLIQAAEVAAEDTLARRAFIGAIARAIYEGDRAVEIFCSGDSADLTEQMLRASQANENLGKVLKQLCPTAVPILIGGAASSASN